jgi:hypothetical protein
VRERGDEAEGLALGLFADRDAIAGVPPVQLGDLAGQIAGPLEALGRHQHRSELGESRLEHCDPTRVAEGAEPLQDHRRRCLGVLGHHGHDVVIEPIECRPSASSLITGRLVQRE